jgi:large subunit ribosomal protein L35
MTLKTKKAAAKRFKLTATGKVKYKKKGMRHGMRKHNRDLKRKRRGAGYLFEGDRSHIEKCLPFG